MNSAGSMTMENIAKNINILGAFCGVRDVAELTPVQLRRACGIERADVMVLFGGSIMCGGDVLADAMRNGVAGKYVIVGGAGHTTETLRTRMREALPGVNTENMSEAEVFAGYLEHRYGLKPDFLECRSTNCGNNITYLLELLGQNGVQFRSIILAQDATMQRRIEAGLRKHVHEDVNIINYAVYSAKVVAEDSRLTYEREIRGMWEMERYISLLMGEISRLSDDENGYGPRGRGFIAHVDIPAEVRRAFEELRCVYSELVREANPLYASVR